MRKLALLLALALSACSPPDCKQACDKLRSCGIDPGSLSCDSSCANKSQDRSCAGCVNFNSCDSIKHGCPSECPGVKF